MVLNVLGQNSAVSYLVIVLHALADVSEQPLKDLLQLLREYHGQINNPGQGGEKLRFLVLGGVRLWHLCCHKPSDVESPFNIAKRVFIRGLSYLEIKREFNNIERSVYLRDLTDGVPSLVSLMSQETEYFEDLSSCFGPLENNWNSLSFEAQKALKALVNSIQIFPNFQLDYQCPQIPKFEDSLIWQEAFWGGFLRIRHRNLTWRSPIHKAFVMTQAQIEADISQSTLLKNSLIDRVERLEKQLQGRLTARAFDECLDELISFSVNSGNIELVPLLDSLLDNQPIDTILIKLEQIASHSSKPWIKHLSNLKAKPQRLFKICLIQTITVAIKKNFLIAHDRSMSGLNIDNSNSILNSDVEENEVIDFVIITVKEEENEAILKRFEQKGSLVGKKRKFPVFELINNQGTKIKIGVIRASEQGTSIAQQVVNDLITDNTLSIKRNIIIGTKKSNF